MKELYNFFSKYTPDAFVRLGECTATWAPIKIENHNFTQATYFVDMGTSNASAYGKGVSVNASLFKSPDGKSWYLHTIFPTLTTAGARGFKSYNLYLPNLGGEIIGMMYACYSDSAESRSNYRFRIEFSDTDYNKY